MKYLIITFVFILSFSSIKAQNTTTCNCCSETHAEFDFWIGKWNVTNPNGSSAGENKIEKIQSNCVLRENWTSATAGYTGTSYNFYNAQKKQWEQIWIDNQGGNLHLKGHRKGNQMILQTDEAKNDKGEPFIHRVTWTENDDGSVRQLWETITNGEKITVAFDGLYKKAK